MKRKLRINGHSHLLPYPEEIPQFMKDKEIFWVDDERKHMLQKGWSRPCTFIYIGSGSNKWCDCRGISITNWINCVFCSFKNRSCAYLNILINSVVIFTALWKNRCIGIPYV